MIYVYGTQARLTKLNAVMVVTADAPQIPPSALSVLYQVVSVKLGPATQKAFHLGVRQFPYETWLWPPTLYRSDVAGIVCCKPSQVSAASRIVLPAATPYPAPQRSSKPRPGE